jgi:hypothetical protein
MENPMKMDDFMVYFMENPIHIDDLGGPAWIGNRKRLEYLKVPKVKNHDHGECLGLRESVESRESGITHLGH